LHIADLHANGETYAQHASSRTWDGSLQTFGSAVKRLRKRRYVYRPTLQRRPCLDRRASRPIVFARPAVGRSSRSAAAITTLESQVHRRNATNVTVSRSQLLFDVMMGQGRALWQRSAPGKRCAPPARLVRDAPRVLPPEPQPSSGTRIASPWPTSGRASRFPRCHLDFGGGGNLCCSINQSIALSQRSTGAHSLLNVQATLIPSVRQVIWAEPEQAPVLYIN
jgi:hypothetical protein